MNNINPYRRKAAALCGAGAAISASVVGLQHTFPRAVPFLLGIACALLLFGIIEFFKSKRTS